MFRRLICRLARYVLDRWDDGEWAILIATDGEDVIIRLGNATAFVTPATARAIAETLRETAAMADDAPEVSRVPQPSRN